MVEVKAAIDAQQIAEDTGQCLEYKVAALSITDLVAPGRARLQPLHDPCEEGQVASVIDFQMVRHPLDRKSGHGAGGALAELVEHLGALELLLVPPGSLVVDPLHLITNLAHLSLEVFQLPAGRGVEPCHTSPLGLRRREP